MPLIYCVLYTCVPESPRYLVTKGKDGEARRIIEQLTIQGDPSPDAALAAIKESIRNAGNENLTCTQARTGVPSTPAPTPADRQAQPRAHPTNVEMHLCDLLPLNANHH